MVNTFVIHSDYRKSAVKLDLLRLRKQIIEAYQIYNILHQFYRISEIEGWEIPPDIEESDHSSPEICAREHTLRIEWAISIRKRYLKLSYRYAVIDGKIMKYPKTRLPYKCKRDQKYSINPNNSVSVWVLPKEEEKMCGYSAKKISKDHIRNRVGYILPRSSVVLIDNGDELWTLGFSQHAAVKMWAGYLPSLKDYINAHIDEYTSRDVPSGGRKCEICLSKFNVSTPALRPWWITETPVVIHSHRASLLRKERDRAEDERYWVDDLILRSKKYLDRGYVWVGSFGENSIKYIRTIMEVGKNISKLPDEIFSPVSIFILSQGQLKKKWDYNGEYDLDQDGYVQIYVKK